LSFAVPELRQTVAVNPFKRGRPIFRLTIPANQSVTVRFQTQHTATRVSTEP
jgi:hypothetical protein